MAISVCFSTSDSSKARSTIVGDAKAFDVFCLIEIWDEFRLVKQPEYATVPEIIKSGRACGYFWWKPFIIYKVM